MTHNLRKRCRELGWRNIAAAHAVQRSRNAAKVQRSRNAAKVVQMLHSFQSPLVTCSRRIDGVSHTIQQPASIALYNRVMGGTDLNDQMIRYYSRMSKAKWTSKVFNHLFHVSAYNAFICHRQLTKSANNFKTFMENVVTQFHNAHTQYQSLLNHALTHRH